MRAQGHNSFSMRAFQNKFFNRPPPPPHTHTHTPWQMHSNQSESVIVQGHERKWIYMMTQQFFNRSPPTLYISTNEMTSPVTLANHKPHLINIIDKFTDSSLSATIPSVTVVTATDD